MLTAAATPTASPYQVEAARRESLGTDADSIARVRAGIPTGLVSIPNRYMHSPSEMVSLTDLDNCAKLIASFTRRLGAEPDFTRR